MTRQTEMSQSGKWTSRFYVCCAAILFALGVWLLIAPTQARGQGLRDNGFALKAGNPSWLMEMTAAGESSGR
jgi:hypothetical protein